MQQFNQRPWKNDPRSKKFSHEQFFGSVSPLKLPDTLGRPERDRENQLGTLRCGSYGAVVNGGYIWGRRFSPDWQAIKIGQRQGRSIDENGSDPNAVMGSMRDDGFLPYELSPVTLERDGVEASADPENYPASLDEQAMDNIPGYVRVDGQRDIFDAICSALFMAYDPVTQKGACVDAFSAWYYEWTMSKIIPTNYSQLGGYHRYLFIDFVIINGVSYLKAQNSYGDDIGDRGFHFFPREVVNREFSTRGTSLKICKTLSPEQLARAKEESPFGKIQRMIIEIWYLISTKWGNV